MRCDSVKLSTIPLEVIPLIRSNSDVKIYFDDNIVVKIYRSGGQYWIVMESGEQHKVRDATIKIF